MTNTEQAIFRLDPEAMRSTDPSAFRSYRWDTKVGPASGRTRREADKAALKALRRR